ncbi:hypothetical protein [Streptomyces sp. ISL-44]|uniref:hypothetical protein n=1 Tax=Streptomyces sp. ISL-44 TaxID=2819184 RepID=UPI0035AC1D2B
MDAEFDQQKDQCAPLIRRNGRGSSRGGIPAEDLAAAGRVLVLVAERANAELAALTACLPGIGRSIAHTG